MSKPAKKKVKAEKLKPRMKFELPVQVTIQRIEDAADQFPCMGKGHMRCIYVGCTTGAFKGMSTMILVPYSESIEMVLRDTPLRRLIEWAKATFWNQKP